MAWGGVQGAGVSKQEGKFIVSALKIGGTLLCLWITWVSATLIAIQIQIAELNFRIRPLPSRFSLLSPRTPNPTLRAENLLLPIDPTLQWLGLLPKESPNESHH